MKCNYWVPILIIFSIISICHADMYIWTDENGVKHFTDSPPAANEVSPEQIEQSETSEYVFNHPLYRKDGDQEYCGKDRLPYPKKNEDTTQYLYNVKDTYRKAKMNRRSLTEDLTTTSRQSAQKLYRDLLYENDCLLDWAAYTIKKLENSKH